MKTNSLKTALLFCIVMSGTILSGQSNSKPALKEEPVTYNADGTVCKGYVVYDGNVKGKRPAIVIAHEWWGMNDYSKMRARMLAELGYIAFAADLFGNGQTAAEPKKAMELTAPFYKDPMLAKTRLDAAIRKLKEYPETDQNNIAAIGYCFGGYVVLNAAKLGDDLKGVVSFHGGLGGAPVDKKLLKAKILICQGASDKFALVKDAELLKHQLDSIGAFNTLKIYPDASHSFTNPDATKYGKEFNLPIEYNPEADRNSWNDMKSFLSMVFKK